MLDAAHLGQALGQVLVEGGHSDLLTRYADVRRKIFLEKTDPITTKNLLRLFSQESPDVEERKEFFTKFSNPKNIVSNLPTLMPDMALTSTSQRIFNATDEVTWFISVTKLADWSDEKFKHEYKVVHANMTRKGAGAGSPLRRYVQLANTKSVPGTKRPDWDYVTSLTMPSLFIVHAGFQHPGYRAAAGSHVFCRLDQQGCIAKKFGSYLNPDKEDKYLAGPIRALIYHERTSETEDFSTEWLEARVAEFSALGLSDEKVLAYNLWQDVTPKNTDYFFRDTQFSGGSWLGFKAVEVLDFADADAATAFLQKHSSDITANLASSITTVVGEVDIIV